MKKRTNEKELTRSGDDALSRVMVSVSDYLWSAEFDDSGRFRRCHYYSPVVEKITGRPPEFFMGGPERWLSIMHPDDRPRLEKTLFRIASGETQHEQEEYRIVTPEGSSRWIFDRVNSTNLEDGGVRLDGVASDITARKDTEELFQTIADGTSAVTGTAFLRSLLRHLATALGQVAEGRLH